MIAVSHSEGTVTSRYIHAIDTASVVADFFCARLFLCQIPLPAGLSGCMMQPEYLATLAQVLLI
jgi:hypothetical protein